MVSYRSADGKQSYHQADELGEAITFVEHLRNDEAVDQARIYRMDEVSFEFRPYYRVELSTGGPASPATGTDETAWLTAQAETTADEVPATAPGEGDEVDPLAAAWSTSERVETRLDDETVGAGVGRRGLFGR
ncbi:MAG TPA: hypothetical protein VGZ52_12305 [Acidimicrobiales bacterium]|jgi:hypothetical protein|nr:hypothetical protein [Acidimicrobiales bacterium]